MGHKGSRYIMAVKRSIRSALSRRHATLRIFDGKRQRKPFPRMAVGCEGERFKFLGSP